MRQIIYCNKKDLNETFGKSQRGDEIATLIMDKLKKSRITMKACMLERTGNRYLLHAQVGASNREEDKRNAPAHRIRVGKEPTLLAHFKTIGAIP